MVNESIYETHPYYYNGTFKSLTDKIPDITDLGIDVIYLMPIWKHKDITVLWDVYSIKDYYDIGPEYGTSQELKELVNTVHSYGMKIIFDLVTPHATTGSIVYNNNWTLNIPLVNLQSIATTNGWTLNYTIVDGINIVYEGKQLQIDGNYTYNFYGTIIDNNVIAYTVPYIWGPATDRSNPELIEYFTNVAKYYVQEYNIDGWRIDVPGNVYNPIVFPGDHSSVNLLTSIINAVKNIKPYAIFIAEPGMPSDVSVNLEYVNMPLTGIMQDIIGNTITTPQLIDYILNIVSNTPLLVLESHDIPRLNINYPIHNKNFMVLISTFYGSPFIQAGQEIGATSTWMTNAQVDWINGDYSLRDFYKKVLSIRNYDNTIKYGLIESIWKSGDNIYAYSMTYENKIAILLNFSNIQTTSIINIPFKNGDTVIDQLSGETFFVTDSTNFIINVPAYSSRILTLPYPSQLETKLVYMSGGLLVGYLGYKIFNKNK